jgi:hypothetical protein
MNCDKKFTTLKAKKSFIASCGIKYNRAHIELPELIPNLIYEVRLENGAVGGLSLEGDTEFTLCFPYTEVIQFNSCVELEIIEEVVCNNEEIERIDVQHNYEYEVKRSTPCD